MLTLGLDFTPTPHPGQCINELSVATTTKVLSSGYHYVVV